MVMNICKFIQRTEQVLIELDISAIEYYILLFSSGDDLFFRMGGGVESDTIIYSGQKDTHHRGVALIMNRESANTLIEWEPINERLIKARFNSRYCKLTIIQCHAPTNDSEDDMKEEWYDQLQAAVSKVPQHDVLLIMGDMNAKTGSDNIDRERVMGREGCGIINESMNSMNHQKSL